MVQSPTSNKDTEDIPLRVPLVTVLVLRKINMLLRVYSSSIIRNTFYNLKMLKEGQPQHSSKSKSKRYCTF